jgi:Leucine Rich repeat
MSDARSKEFRERRHPSATESPFRAILTAVVIIGVCAVLMMANMAFGLSGFGFAAVIVICALALIAYRYRFNLRTLLLVMTALSIWLGLKIGRENRLQQAINTVTNVGGHLKVHDRSPDFPWGLWANRYELDFYGVSKPLPEATFAHFGTFAPSNLSDLELSNTGVTDASLKYVGQLCDLEHLSLANETYLSGEKIPGKRQNHITDTGLQEISGLTELKRIQLGGTDITDEGLKSLTEMWRLRCIYLEGTKIEGTGFAHLRLLKDLLVLELNGCPISSDGYAELLKMPNLTCIGLNSSGTTDADLDRLSALPNLSIVRLAGDQVSEDAVKRFSAAHPNCKIER